MRPVQIFGFGSFFRNENGIYKDIDLLLVHHAVTCQSVGFVILCKDRIRALVQQADIVMLSAAEQHELKFIERAKARYIMSLNENQFEVDVRLLAAILDLNRMRLSS
ncbi:hypothetical protein [Terrarubrum flagellatum]|uniref:hypothetical protein n=1 Tax=Terrirubrum flagellatum TaxID=2895980 RepID=UPI003144DBF7